MNELINLGNGQFVKVTMLKGEKGSNIATITKTGTSGLVDTYTITLTDGSTTTFEVTNGNSIDHVTKTSTVGLTDTYTIYLEDGSEAGTFTVTNATGTIDQDFSSTSENPLQNKTLSNIIAGIENGATASQTYNVNDIILRGDSLYRVTTTIASGGTIADGVNIEEYTIGGLLTVLKNTLRANNNDFSASYQNGKYGFSINNTFYAIGGSGMPDLDYAHPVHSMVGISNDTSWTVTEDCYMIAQLCATNASNPIVLLINGSTVVRQYNPSALVTSPLLKLKKNDVVRVYSTTGNYTYGVQNFVVFYRER